MYHFQAWKKRNDGTPLELLDMTLSNSYSSVEVTRCIHVGLCCVQEDPDQRPSMQTVVLLLNHLNDQQVILVAKLIKALQQKILIAQTSLHLKANRLQFLLMMHPSIRCTLDSASNHTHNSTQLAYFSMIYIPYIVILFFICMQYTFAL